MYTGRQPSWMATVDCECAVAQAASALNQAGYSTLRSFDSHAAMTGQITGGCLVVLLVYAQEGSPATLIFDSQDSCTGIYLVSGSHPLNHDGLIQTLKSIFPASLSGLNEQAA
jgi:hypothetical protein